MGRPKGRHEIQRTRSGWISALAGIAIGIAILAGMGYVAKDYFFAAPTSTPDITPELTVTATPTVEITPEPTEAPSMSLVAVGDIMCHDSQLDDARGEDGSYDFSDWFASIQSYIQAGDLAVANFETTLGGESVGYRGYPCFSTPDSILDALKSTGFDILTTANNHCLDTGYAGAQRTLQTIRSAGFQQTGTYADENEYNQVLMVECNGFKLAFLAYTYGCNGMDASLDSSERHVVKYMGNDYMTQIRQDIQTARSQGADLVIVSSHWGTEYVTHPSDYIIDLGDTLFKAGADIILGSHPHVLQPIDRKTIVRDDGTEAEVAVIYSMGNFISGQRTTPRDASAIFTFNITRDDQGKAVLGDITYLPVWVKASKSLRDYEILPVGKYMNDSELFSTLTQDQQTRLQAVWNETTALLGRNDATPLTGDE